MAVRAFARSWTSSCSRMARTRPGGSGSGSPAAGSTPNAPICLRSTRCCAASWIEPDRGEIESAIEVASLRCCQRVRGGGTGLANPDREESRVLRRWLGRSEQTAHRVAIRPGDCSIDVAPDLTVLEAALRQGVPFPHSCRVGTCGTCKCRLVSGKVYELSDKAYVLSGEELSGGFILACQSLPRSDVQLEVPNPPSELERLPVVQRAGTITSVQRLTHD